ncbi:MAG: archaellin/type IV pilin N-terminal domain-containing protein [Nitrososphaeria archaeon]
MAAGRRRAVAPIIATMILIAVTLAAGVTLYSYARQVMVQSSVAQAVYVQDVNLLAQGGGPGVLTVTVKDPGTISISEVDLMMFDGVVLQSPVKVIGAVAPGQSAGGAVDIGPNYPVQAPGPLMAGVTYPVELQVVYANGVVQTIPLEVVATGSDYVWASGPVAAPSNDTPSIEASIGPASNGFAVRVKNTGKSNLKTITVYVYNASGSLVLTSAMYPGNGGVPPGQTISNIVTGALGPGQYTVKLVVQNPSNNTVVAALHAVVAEGGGHGR